MNAQTLALLIGAVVMALAAGLVFAVAAHTGQFDRIEDPKYRMLRDSEPEEDTAHAQHDLEP